jgi:hypothetical protein
MASKYGKSTRKEGDVTLTTMLRQRLRSEDMKDVEISANSVHVPGGQLMATFMLCFPESLPNDTRHKMEKIALEECATYLQAPHGLETPPDETRNEPRAMGLIRQETKIPTPRSLRS